MEKCFCHFNGYKVKDADARRMIEEERTAREKAVADAKQETAESSAAAVMAAERATIAAAEAAQYAGNVGDIFNVEWESGGVSIATGAEYENETCIRSGYIPIINGSIGVIVPDGVEFELAEFNSNLEFIQAEGYPETLLFEGLEGRYARITAYYTEEIEASPEMGELITVYAQRAVPCAVRYDEQTLTPEQQAQARKNIGAVDEDFVNDCIGGIAYKTVITAMEPVEMLEAYCLLQGTGALTQLSSGDKNYIVKKYDVTGVTDVKITASANMSNYLYSFCNASGGVVACSDKAATGTALTEIEDQAAQVPETAVTLYVSYIKTATKPATVNKVESRPVGMAQKWIGKKWACIGDSLTATNQRTEKHYHDYITENTGITVVNMGSNGTGYARGGSDTFYERVSNVPVDADVVTIFGSGNDLTAGIDLGEITDAGTDTLCGCINTTIDNLIAIMPAVQIGIVTPTPWVGQQPGAGKPMEDYANAIVEICKARSIPVLDLYHCSNLRPWTEEGRAACYSKDDGNGVHPDETGHKIIAPRFKAFLESLLM